MKILSLFDKTGIMVRPWAEAGHECFIVDTQHPSIRDVTKFPSGGSIKTICIDLFHFHKMILRDLVDPDMVFGFPPCTHLASSGARWFESKGLKTFIGALQLVQNTIEICEASGAPWMIENPVGRLSTAWRKPDAYVHPWEYSGYLSPEGDGYTKRTCLWTGGGFVMPEKKPFSGVPDNKYIHHCPPGAERANIRSATPQGFAIAVYEANKPEENDETN